MMGRIIQFKTMVLAASTLAIFVLVACGGSANTPEPSAPKQTLEPASTTAPTATRPGPTLAPSTPDLNVELEGDGPGVLGPVIFDTGVLIAFVRHEGDGPFSMTFLGGEMGTVQSIDARPGPYRGELVHSVFNDNPEGLVPGEYTIDVQTTGPWRLRLFQENATAGQSPTVSLAGIGDGGGSWLRLDEGEYTMTTSHTGPTGFTVELFDSIGLYPYTIVQATGSYQGEDRFIVGGGEPGENPQAGFYAMGVRSEGDWEVTITSDDVP